jgi:hypothetical protein
MRKLHIINTTCKRCGKPLATLNRSLWGADAAKQEYGSICEKCITPLERQAIEQALDNAVYRKCANA